MFFRLMSTVKNNLYLMKNVPLVGLIFLLISTVRVYANSKDSLAQAKGKNIVIILVDDLRPMLGAYGDTFIKTPHMDRLAQRAIQFNRAYANVPVCGASRASFLTGLRPTKTRFLKASSSIDVDSPNAESFPALLKRKGYTTISNGKVSHRLKDAQHSWSEIWSPPMPNTWRDYILPDNYNKLNAQLPVPAYEAADVADSLYFDGKTTAKSIEDIKKLHRQKQPFLVIAGLRKPHLPFNAPKKYWEMYDSEKIPLPKNNQFPQSVPAVLKAWYELPFYKDIKKGQTISENLSKTLIHGYAACVSYIDAQVGKIINTLDELEITEDTIVILMSDHGFSLSEHNRWSKHALFEVELKIPLLIHAPGFTNYGQSSSIAELVDIYPTLCDLIELPKPKELQGNSLVNALADPDKLFKKQGLARWKNGETLITTRYFYSEWQNKMGRVTDQLLFDHYTDPNETINIAQRPEMKKTVDSLQKILYHKISKL